MVPTFAQEFSKSTYRKSTHRKNSSIISSQKEEEITETVRHSKTSQNIRENVKVEFESDE